MTIGFKGNNDGSGAIQVNGVDRLQVGTVGQFGTGSPISYGASGQVLTSNGPSAAPSWQALSIPASGQLQSQVFGASGSWTAPAGVTRVRASVIGGAGGTAYCTDNDGAVTQGGFGGCAVGVYTVVPGTSYTVTIGAGGAGSTGPNTRTGGAGGTSSFASFCSATGGGGGTSLGGGSNGPIGANGTGSNGNLRNGATGDGLGVFNGRATPSSASGTPYTVTSGLTPGAGVGVLLGAGPFTAAGGVGGIVYLEWVGG